MRSRSILPLLFALAGCGGAGGDAAKVDALENRIDALEARMNSVKERASSPDFALPKKRGDLEPK